MKTDKKYFFGWENIKWFLRELLKVASGQPSFFSKKRVESGIAFWVLIWGLIFYLSVNVVGMSATDFLLWSAVPCALCGIYLNKIEQAKNIISETKQEITIKETETNQNIEQ